MKCPTTAPAITATAATNSAPRTNVRLLWTPSAGSPRPICSNRAADYLGPSPTAVDPLTGGWPRPATG
jgi:hypothetical protein